MVRPVSLGLPADLLQAVDKQAKRWECSRSAAVVRMLKEWQEVSYPARRHLGRPLRRFRLRSSATTS